MEDKVIINFKKYHEQMNELEVLREIIIDYMINPYEISEDELQEKIVKQNKKYQWWV